MRSGCATWLLLLPAAAALSGCSWIDKVRGHPTLQAQNFMEQAERAEADGDVAQAGLLLSRAIDANPEDAEGHRELSRLLLKQGEVDAAIRQLQLAAGQNPDNLDNYARLARIQLDHRRLDGAERAIDAALAVDAKHVEALLLKGELAELRRRDALAMETYYRVLSRDPENIAARQRLADLQIDVGRPDRAAPLLRAICECPQADDAQLAAARWSLGMVYGQRGRWQEAVESLAAAAPDRQQMTADDWYRLAYARYAAGDLNGAWSDLERALRHQPGHSRAIAMQNTLQSMAGRNYERMAMAVPTPAGW